MRWMLGLAALAAAGGASLMGGGSARAACQLQQVGELPVVQAEGHMMLVSSINGQPVMLIADTGASLSTMFGGAPQRLGLTVHDFDRMSVRMSGIGGTTVPKVATIKELRFGKFVMQNTQMLTGGRQLGSDAVVGVMGQELFSRYDVEVDLAHGVIRLLNAKDCSDSQMPYWGSAYSQAPLEPTSATVQRFTTAMMLNGRRIEADIDTGSPITTITSAAARAAGARPDPDAPVIEMGGLGSHRVQSSVYIFDTVGVGDEVVKNTRLSVADLFHYNTQQQTGTRLGTDTSDEARALIGLDFFRSHRVMISPSHHMIYFSYLGGTPFIVPRRRPVQATAPSPSASPAAAQTPQAAASPQH